MPILDDTQGALGAAARSNETDDRDRALVTRARAGDRAAFEALMETNLPRVWRVVWRILRHREDTEDVVQEVFLAAHGALAEFRGEARVSTWLHRIAVNRALNHRQKASERLRRASLSLAPAADGEAAVPEPVAPLSSLRGSPMRALELRELRRRLAECLAKLPQAWRAVLALRDGESMSYQEIAAVAGIALGTVRSRLSRSRMALKQCIEEGVS